VPAELRFFLRRGQPAGTVTVSCDGTSTATHVVESAGVPRTEIGALMVGGRAVPPSYVPRGGDVIEVRAVPRPQRVDGERFLLDVHLGALARRLRLLGIDTAYSTDADDDTLVEQANAEHRVLLSRDRGLLRRRALWCGAYVRGDQPDDQLADVLDRFAPELSPWTRCLACNGPLVPATRQQVDQQLKPGTRRTYREFARCAGCGRAYWRGAHAGHLEAIVSAARAGRG